MNIFKMASQRKLRFKTRRGELAVEDLWGLSVPSLDLVGKTVKVDVRDAADSMIKQSDKSIIENDLKLFILTEIITDKQNVERKGILKKSDNPNPEEPMLLS